jgi:hypothetical protein
MFKNRLFFVQKDSLKCWYLGTNSIGGAANVIDFSGVARWGGKLVAITTIPTSAGDSLDDYFCAITSEGELLVYQGTDPTSVSTFALVGVYRVGRPIANGSAIDGSRFFVKFGSEVVAITVDGLTTLQSALKNDVVAQSTTMSKNIVNSVTRDAALHKDNFGWQIVLAPKNNKILINVPIGNGDYYQHVMNTITGAWCRFTGLNTTCFAYFNDHLWAVIGNAVYKIDEENTSDTISFHAKTAYNYFQDFSSNKMFHMARPLIRSTDAMSMTMNVDYDFLNVSQYGDVNVSAGNSSLFDSALFDVSLFTSDTLYFNDWISINGMGFCASFELSGSATGKSFEWYNWAITYEPGGVL